MNSLKDWSIQHARRRRLRISSFAALVLTLGLLVAVANASPSRQGANDTLTFAIAADVPGFDPPVTSGPQEAISIELQLFDRLLELGPNNKTFVPGLATSWKFTNGGRSVVFTLRQGVKFSDGSPVTADDVVFSLRRATGPDVPYGILFGGAVKSVTKVDAQHVRITLSRPSLRFCRRSQLSSEVFTRRLTI